MFSLSKFQGAVGSLSFKLLERMDYSFELNIKNNEKIYVNYFGEANGAIKYNLEKQLSEAVSTAEVELQPEHIFNKMKLLDCLKEQFTFDFLKVIMQSPLFVLRFSQFPLTDFKVKSN